MAQDTVGTSIASLFQGGKWADARKLLEAELVREPENHWLLTQLGVTYHEERRYHEALEQFLAAGRIMPDCPLVLWNQAGALDALRKHDKAIKVYSRLLECKIQPKVDPCWESADWGAALKADCVYRLGACLQQLKKKPKAEECFRQYLNLLLGGIEGSYSLQDVSREIRGLHESNGPGPVGSDLQNAIRAVLQTAGAKLNNGARKSPPKKKIVSSRKKKR